MTIKVKYFAALRERLGREADEVAAEDVATVADVWDRASGGRPLPDNILLAVNLEYARADAVVSDGDEVAFFPPVTGGCHDG